MKKHMKNEAIREWRGVAIVLGSLLALSACSSDDDGGGAGASNGGGGDNTGGGNASGMARSGDFAVAQNDGTNAGSVHMISADIASTATVLNTGANQGITFDTSGTLYQNSDSDGATGTRAFAQAAARMSQDDFNTGLDRILSSIPGKGLASVANGSLLVSCDVTDENADIKIFASTAGADAAPLASVDTDASAWDVFYDDGTDTLYAALTNGSLAIFDEFTADISSGPDRTVTPVDDAGQPVSVNFHGVFVADGTILVSDVGDAMSATDGALFTFVEDGSIDGNVTAYTRIAGGNTELGNPVDVVLNNGGAVVAEKSNDRLLVFDAITMLSDDVIPTASIEFAKPESIALNTEQASVIDASDIDSEVVLEGVAVALNPSIDNTLGVDVGVNASVGTIRLPGASLDASSTFSTSLVTGDPGSQSFMTLENIQYDSQGNLFATFDVTDGNTVSDREVLVLHQANARVNGSLSLTDRDRVISGADSSLSSPKGIELVESRGMMIVADIGNESVAATLKVFAMNAGDNASPVFTVSSVGDGAIWDIDYDPANDRLFAAGTAGDVLVYDDFFASAASATPARTLRPSSAGATTNMHGVVHVAADDRLIITDVGDAGVADDGKLYVVDAAATANGMLDAALTIAGSSTELGNPVDIAFDGTSVYVAEKSNDRLLVFSDLLTLSGSLDVAATQSIEMLKPESVTLKAQ